MTTAVYEQTFDAITTLAEEEAVRVARRDQLRRLLLHSDHLLDRAERDNRDDKPRLGWRLRRDIGKLEREALGEIRLGVKTPQQAVDCLFSLQTVLLDWLAPGYDHSSRKEDHDG